MKLSPSGMALAALAALLGLTGAIMAHPTMLAGSSVALAVLGAAWLLTPKRIQVVHSGALDLVWWVDVPSRTQGVLVAGMNIDIHVAVRNRSALALGRATMKFLTGPGLETAPLCITLSPGRTTSASSTLLFRAVGRWLVHGAVITFQGPVGLFLWDAYFPASRAIRVLSDAVVRRNRSAADAGSPFSYLAVDMDIYHELQEGEGQRQLSRLFVLLSELHTVVEQGFTDSTDQEVVEAIGRYLAYQHGLQAKTSFDDPQGNRRNSTCLSRTGARRVGSNLFALMARDTQRAAAP